jgi:hypothetical protein
MNRVSARKRAEQFVALLGEGYRPIGAWSKIFPDAAVALSDEALRSVAEAYQNSGEVKAALSQAKKATNGRPIKPPIKEPSIIDLWQELRRVVEGLADLARFQDQLRSEMEDCLAAQRKLTQLAQDQARSQLEDLALNRQLVALVTDMKADSIQEFLSHVQKTLDRSVAAALKECDVARIDVQVRTERRIYQVQQSVDNLTGFLMRRQPGNGRTQ